MRNLKRVLSLALACVMVIGMMVMTTGAADLKDYDEITNVEAVDVMVALGVLEGDDLGNFNPEKILTREEAAKIICFMKMGPANAEKLAGTSNFTDVEADRWSAPYISYCNSLDIISGYNGKFDPAGQLTDVAFGKMLLVALGYDAQLEGYVNNTNWATNIGADMIDAKINSGAVTGAYVTREAAAQMAFNTLKADMVDYETKGVEITQADGSKIVVGASKAAPVTDITGTDYNSLFNEGAVTTQQFAEKHFDILRYNTTANYDAFERPQGTWTTVVSGVSKLIGSYPIKAALTYTTEVSKADLYTALNLTATESDIDYYVDGTAVTYTGDTDTDTVCGAIEIDRGNKTDKIGGNGALVQVYTNIAGQPIRVTVVNTYIGDVTAVVPETPAADAYIFVSDRGLNGTSGAFETEDFAKDDVVLYTYSYKAGETGVQTVELADSAEGTMTEWVAGKTMTVDGVPYEYSAKIVDAGNNFKTDSKVTMYLDTYGYVIDVDGPGAEAKKFAYVLYSTDEGGLLDNEDVAQLLLPDATEVTVNCTNDFSTDFTGKMVTYTINPKSGKYTLTDATHANSVTTADTTAAIVKGSDTVTAKTGKTFTANGGTTFLVATKVNNKVVYTAYNGIDNVPSITAGSTGYTTVWAEDRGAAKLVFVDLTGDDATVNNGAAGKFVFILGDKRVTMTETSAKGQFYTYKAIVDGVITTIDAAAQYGKSGSADFSELYDVVTYDDKGVATLSTSARVKTTGFEAVKNNVVGLGGSYLPLASDVKAFYVNGANIMMETSVDALKSDKTDAVYYLTQAGKVTMIIVEDVVSNANDLVKDDTKYTVTDAAPTAVGGADNAATASVSAAAGKKVGVMAGVSDEASIAGVTVAVTSGTANGTINADNTYTVGDGDTNVEITWTYTILAEDGQTTNSTATVVLTISAA